MKKLLKSALRVLLVIAVYLPFLAATSVDRDAGPVPEFSGRINDFAIDLLKHEAATHGARNTMLSPLSIYSGLAMSYIASGGDTRLGLAQALHFPADNDALIRDLAGLRRKIFADGQRPGIELRMADSVWLDTTNVKYRKDYLGNLDRMDVLPAREVKFAEKQKACDEINAWVSAMTSGRITQCIQPSDIPSRTLGDLVDEPGLVTVDAAWFKAQWMHRFDEMETTHRMFNTPGGGNDTPMMHQQSLFLYADDAHFKLLDMPYRGGRYSMIILLPREITGVNAVMPSLTTGTVMDLMRLASPRDVDVLLPKLTIKCHTDLQDALTSLGAGAAFDREKADFDAMIVPNKKVNRIYLSSAHHDAWMEVGEEGTEAAAVTTGVHIELGCAAEELPRPAEFHADHPFLFFIVHNPSRSILFAGWIANPAALDTRD